MERLADWAWRRFGPRYFKAYVAFEVASALIITVGALGLLTLYEDVSRAEFVRIVLFSWACVAISLTAGTAKVFHMGRPLLDWARGERGREGAADAWRTAISLPVQFVTRAGWLPVVTVALPVSVYTVLELD